MPALRELSNESDKARYGGDRRVVPAGKARDALGVKLLWRRARALSRSSESLLVRESMLRRVDLPGFLERDRGEAALADRMRVLGAVLTTKL